MTFDRISALVFAFSGEEDIEDGTNLRGLGEDLRLAKAGVLYADSTTISSVRASIALERMRVEAGRTGHKFSDDPLTDAFSRWEWPDIDLDEREERALLDFIDGLKRRAFTVPRLHEAGIIAGIWVAGRRPDGVIPLFGEAGRAGLMRFSAQAMERLKGPAGDDLLRLFRSLAEDAATAGARDRYARMARDFEEDRASGRALTELGADLASPESDLLLGVLGGLPAFPDAEWDVLLDVRERLTTSRAHLRAAISNAANELDGASRDEVAAVSVALRRRVIGPAIAEIEESLADLRAAPTLLRIAKSNPTITMVAANLAIAATDVGNLGLSALIHGVASTPLLTAAIQEILHQRETRRAAAKQPYWILREVSRRTAG